MSLSFGQERFFFFVDWDKHTEFIRTHTQFIHTSHNDTYTQKAMDRDRTSNGKIGMSLFRFYDFWIYTQIVLLSLSFSLSPYTHLNPTRKHLVLNVFVCLKPKRYMYAARTLKLRLKTSAPTFLFTSLLIRCKIMFFLSLVCVLKLFARQPSNAYAFNVKTNRRKWNKHIHAT